MYLPQIVLTHALAAGAASGQHRGRGRPKASARWLFHFHDALSQPKHGVSFFILGLCPTPNCDEALLLQLGFGEVHLE